ncbi:hypothetical protein BC937DRAFT_90097 [Endogone sp. FLAS-F59071]|nr:hypothetical protein BC937DRAFT_90097 [Endogone sp. FLAS-F59071]|eukprot:RUS22181.1 hypothetical protein BC937DRAFT_90097 [Endogone sp. FLAS-F59071]
MTSRFFSSSIHNLRNPFKSPLLFAYAAAQGGDWGSIISRFLPQLHPAHCRAIHINMPPPIMPIPWTIWRPITSLRAFLGMAFGYQYFYSEREARDLADTGKFIKDESGYQALQGTKPQTLAYGLSDSPVGLLAWLLEKYHTWTEHSADSEALTAPNVTRDDILAIITTYYITSTISSSIRIYYEFLHSSDDLRLNRLYVKAPVGVALFKGELYKVGT